VLSYDTGFGSSTFDDFRQVILDHMD
jgi:hypothetical protein